MISERGWPCLQVRTGRFPGGPEEVGVAAPAAGLGPGLPLLPHSPTGVGSGVCPRKQAASRTLRHTSGPAQVWTRARGARALARGTPPVSPAASFLESQHEVWVPTVRCLILSHLDRAGPGTWRPLSSEAGRCTAAMRLRGCCREAPWVALSFWASPTTPIARVLVPLRSDCGGLPGVCALFPPHPLPPATPRPHALSNRDGG